MSGLDKIVEEIIRQANEEAKKILDDADKYCEDYSCEAKKSIDAKTALFDKEQQEKRELYISKTESGAKFNERNAILKTKQECIDMVIEKAKNSILSMPDKEYFEFLLKVLKSNMQKESGVMKFGKNDLNRVTEEFKKQVEIQAEESGINLTISEETANIKDGFILVYGEIEQNCTLDALINEKSDKLRDAVSSKLFG